MANWDKRKRYTAGLSVASNSLLVMGKFIVGFSMKSVSVISEAVHSGIDLIAAVIAFIAVWQASKPPDREHPFGHGKAEPISGSFEGMLIFVAIVVIIYESIKKIITGAKIHYVFLGLIVMGFSALLNTVISWQLYKVARETDSIALEADAIHLSNDVFTSLGVFAGLLIIQLTGMHILDPIIALGVAVVIGRSAFNIIKRSVKDLMDERISDKEIELVENVLTQHHCYFIGFHNLRSRKSGAHREIDLHLVQCRHIHLEDAHAVCDHLEEELKDKLGKVNITIHTEPCELVCEEGKIKCSFFQDKLLKNNG
ncbi:MAG: cation diffusion facilitator family transporter [bacterium]